MTDASLEARIAALADRRAIEELRARYGWTAARGDAAGVAACYSEDCVYEGPGGGPGKRDAVRTRQGVADYFSTRLKPGAQTPLLYNHIIKLNGDTAEGTCAIRPHVAAGGKEMVGFYDEKLKKIDGHWYFQERRFYLYQPYSEV